MAWIRPRIKTVALTGRITPADKKRLMALAEIAGTPGRCSAGLDLLLRSIPDDPERMRAMFVPLTTGKCENAK